MFIQAIKQSIGEDHEEPIGLAKATKAYNLPSRYVLHTVGPSIMDGRRRGRISTADEDAQVTLVLIDA